MSKRGGRKRRAGKREPNGKPSRRQEHQQERRSAEEVSSMGVATAARVRVHDVAIEHAGTELAGTVVGRCYLKGELDPAQLNAARLLVDTYGAYQRAIDSPRPPKAVNIEGMSGGTPREISPERANEARKQWGTILGIIQAANNVHRYACIYAACDYVVLQDKDLPHLLPHLRLGLNAIAQAYGLAEKAA